MRASSTRGPRPVPVHYLRGNASVWTPGSLIYLDSETAWATDGTDELHTLRCWTALHVDRAGRRSDAEQRCWGEGTTADELADWLVGRTRGRKTVWVYAHNLAFDLVTTALPQTMVARGWAITDFALRSESPWMRLTDGRCTVTVCDSWSWLPEKLASLSSGRPRTKQALPDPDAPLEAWLAYGRTDTEVLADLMGELLNWWDRNALGRWSITGASCGWNAMRHRPTLERTVIDCDPELLAGDRAAIRGGRRDVTICGDLGEGDWVDIDFADAYPTIAATLPLPRRRGAVFASLPIDHRAVTSKRWGIIATVTVTCDRPRYPMTWRGVTWYPVGTFTTTLAGPEIAWAAENGDLQAIGAGQFHQLGHQLADWATWVMGISSGAADDSPPAARVLAKSWGRTVIGKWAARTQSTTAFGDAPTLGWSYHEARDHSLGRPAAWVDLAGRRYLAVYDTEGDNPYPAVYAWVESAARVALGRMLDALPDGMWVQADTDSALLDLTEPAYLRTLGVKLGGRPPGAWAAAQAVCDHLAPITWPLTARPKAQHRRLEIIGPQHLTTDTERRLSGVRRDATGDGPHAWVQRDWPKLPAQLARDTPGTYVRPLRRHTFTRPLVHRWILADGHTLPVVADLDDAGANTVRPWAESWGRLFDAGDLPDQYQGLAGLY